MKSKNKTVFVCQNCGAQKAKWEGKCTDCGAWNSLVEETFSTAPDQHRGWSVGSGKKSGKATAATSTLQVHTLEKPIAELQVHRHKTGSEELDRVLGGGLVAGSFVLLGGSPGVGKSTLLLQMAGGLAKNNCDVLYVSAEESVAQTGSRAQRLGVRSEKVQLCSESNLSLIIELARERKPEVLIVDSIQTVYLPELPAAPGSVSQVRECAGHLMSLAKNEGMSVLLIGHVTKDGTLAGPKVLEHMVDCVLSFDGESSIEFRLLRCLKNRFGATFELGVFQMFSGGLREVSNPSEIFLEERVEKAIGSVVFASIEGSRPLLCEVQALTAATPMTNPRRTAVGIEVNRLHLLSAVLDRHLDAGLAAKDVFVNIVGGLKLFEPSSDLAVAAALLSTEGNQSIDGRSLFFGEIGLTGEVRAVSFPELRIREGVKLGFTHFVIPHSNKRHLQDYKLQSSHRITWVKNIRELPSAMRVGNGIELAKKTKAEFKPDAEV